MSSTRQVQAGERRRQNGWASAVEYDCLRGIDGNAVALKAALQDTPEKSELLYFLQALSLRDGGTKRIAAELVEMFPERIGTPTMHKIRCKPGKTPPLAQRVEIFLELNPESILHDHYREAIVEKDPSLESDYRFNKTIDDFHADCLAEANNLDQFLEELCCNPKVEISRQAESQTRYQRQAQQVLADAREALRRDSDLAGERPELKSAIADRKSFRFAEVPYFHDLLGALFEYQRRHAEKVRAEFVETQNSKIVFEAFDYALQTGGSALIEGDSGFGKSHALKACCEMNLGRVRYVELESLLDRTKFAQILSDATGVARGKGFSPARRLIRVQEFLRRSKIMLVIDEAQYLWPQGKRVTVHPELVNWIGTALYNAGIPFVLSATKQFTLRRQHVEQQTDWNSGQLRRRIRRVFPLPNEIPADDLRAVTRSMLGHLGEAAVDYVSGYVLTCNGNYQTISTTIEDAMFAARRAGRENFTAKDIQLVIKQWRGPSDAALQRVFDSKPEGRRRASNPTTKPSDYESPDREFNEPLNRGSRPVETGFTPRETRPQGVPALAG